MTPAPESAYKDQQNKVRAMTEVITEGYQRPLAAIRAIFSPAPKNRYQEGPKTIQPTCRSAATALSAAPMIRKLFRSLSNGQAPLFFSSQSIGSHNSTLFPSGSMIHANFPFS